jgi:peptide/nickel transport system substrate-binding protein
MPLAARRPWARAAIALFLLLVPLGSHPVGASPANQAANTLVIDTTAEAESLDPALVAQASGFSIMSSIFDNLVERDYSGALVPMLAESWTFPDPNTVEFKLRQGVTFQNGEPFNAAAVKYSIERVLDPAINSPLVGGWPKSFQGVEVVDDSTVRLRFSQPEATIFDTLAQSAEMVPPSYYSSNSEDFLANNPVGSGPFRFVEAVRDDHTTLTRNPNYWGVDTYKGSAQVQTVVFRPVPDPGTRVADLLNGTADMIFDVPPDDVGTLRGRASEGFQVVTGNSAKLQFIEFMPKSSSDPLADRRVRQALNMAVDVDAITANLANGLGRRQASPIMEGSLGFDPSVPAFEYNPTFARQLLAAAGVANGFSATMDLSSSDSPTVALAVIGQLQQVGVNVTPRTLELGTFNNAWCVSTPQFACQHGESGDTRMARWGGLQDPAVFLNFTTVCGGFLADPYTCNQDVTNLARQAASTFDQDVRAGLYAQISRLLHDDPMGIYLGNVISTYGVGPRVQGWRGPTGRDYLIPTNITLTQ